MRFTRIHLYMAGLVAFLIGMPLTKDALASSTGGIIGSSLDLAYSIAQASGGS